MKNKYKNIEELELPVTCPICRSDNVIIEVVEGYFYVEICKECGYQMGNLE